LSVQALNQLILKAEVGLCQRSSDIHEDAAQRKTAESSIEDYPHVVAVELDDFLLRDFPPRTNLLDPWLPTQGLAMVYAARGIGKTFFGLSVAHAIAGGGSFLKYHAPSPSGVLYIDGEMPASTMQERLKSITKSSDKKTEAAFKLLTPDLQPCGVPRLDTLEGQSAIDEIITDDIKLIVVNNISTLTSAKENDADGWTPVQQWALRMRASGRSVLFIHHAGKGGNQRGTSRREDVLDTVISLRRPRNYESKNGAEFEIHFEKSRAIHGDDVKTLEAKLIINEHGVMSWDYHTVDDSTFEKVITLLNEGMKQEDIANELAINKSNVSRHAARARDEGRVNKVK